MAIFLPKTRSSVSKRFLETKVLNAKKLIFLANELRNLCNENGTPTPSMVHTAHMIREELADYIEQVSPDTFTSLPNPKNVEADGFPAEGNRVYHPTVDKCFHSLVKQTELTESALYGALIQEISSENLG
jgi:hypothetical protein